MQVELGERSYPIHIGRDLSEVILQEINILKKNSQPVAILTDENVYHSQAEFIEKTFSNLPILKLLAGESTKSLESLGKVYNFLAENKIDRTGALIVMGGGVIGDLGGFAAATYLRGIDFYQIPTSLLAMVDSSVGGKTGINLVSGKNLVGSFYQPKAVYIETENLKTLPANEFNAGMSEIIKYGMLDDENLFNLLEKSELLVHDSSALPNVIETCCEIKANIVKADEKELAGSGGRALLNLGHTFAHAIEAVTEYGEYLHGEAVAVGLVLAARLSETLGNISNLDVERVINLVKRYSLPVKLKNSLDLEKLIEAMLRDKKVRQGKLRFVVMDKIGKAVTIENVDMDLVRKLWQEVI